LWAKRPFAKDLGRGAETSAGGNLEDSTISKKKGSNNRGLNLLPTEELKSGDELIARYIASSVRTSA
jgi:hypothetical protein